MRLNDKNTFKAIKWYLGEPFYDSNKDYLNILKNEPWIEMILSAYYSYLKTEQPFDCSEMNS